MTAHLRDEDEVSLGDASERRALAGRRQDGGAQRWMAVGAAPQGREVEEIPEWVDGVVVARVLSRIGRSEEKFGAPEMADCFAVAPEYVDHRHLVALLCLAKVGAFVGVAVRGQQPQRPPTTRLCMSQAARQWSLGDDGEIDALRAEFRFSVQCI